MQQQPQREVVFTVRVFLRLGGIAEKAYALPEKADDKETLADLDALIDKGYPGHSRYIILGEDYI